MTPANEPEECRFERDGVTLRGLLASPKGIPCRGGVVVVPSVHGITDYILTVSRRLAATGFAAMTLDPYSRGDHPGDLSTPEAVRAGVAALADERVAADVAAAGQHLAEVIGKSSDTVGLLGFCVGGLYTFLGGCLGDFAGVVDYYGMIRYDGITEAKPRSPIEYVAQLRAPLLAHYGELDPWCPPEHVRDFADELRRQGKVHEIYHYPGAGHAFDEFDRNQVYRPAAAADAWRRTLAFFDYHIAGELP